MKPRYVSMTLKLNFSHHIRRVGSLRPKKVQQSRSQVEEKWILLSPISGVVHHESILMGGGGGKKKNIFF